MKMKKTMLLIVVVFLLLTSCSKTKANTKEPEAGTNAVAKEPSVTATENVAPVTVYPLPDDTMENLTDATLSVSLEEGDAYVDSTGKMQMDVKIYTYDLYDAKSISELKVGDAIVTYAGEVEVVSVEHGKGGSVYINGGLEKGGFDLVPDGGGIFYEIGFNDAKNWYEIGEATIRVSTDFIGYDNADPDRGKVIIYPGDFLVGAVTDYNFTPHNTTIRVEAGQIVEMNRIYTP